MLDPSVGKCEINCGKSTNELWVCLEVNEFKGRFRGGEQGTF